MNKLTNDIYIYIYNIVTILTLVQAGRGGRRGQHRRHGHPPGPGRPGRLPRRLRAPAHRQPGAPPLSLPLSLFPSLKVFIFLPGTMIRAMPAYYTFQFRCTRHGIKVQNAVRWTIQSCVKSNLPSLVDIAHISPPSSILHNIAHFSSWPVASAN